MPASNFLLCSKTYAEKQGQISGKHRKVGQLAIAQEVFTRLNSDYTFPAGQSKLIKDVVNALPVKVVPEIVRRFIIMAMATKDFLQADEEEKKKIIKRICSVRGGKSQYFRFGINCFMMDGLDNWERIMVQTPKEPAVPAKTEKTVSAITPAIPTPTSDQELLPDRGVINEAFRLCQEQVETVISRQAAELADLRQAQGKSAEIIDLLTMTNAHLEERLASATESLIAKDREIARLNRRLDDEASAALNQVLTLEGALKNLQEKNRLLEEKCQALSADNLVSRLTAAIENLETKIPAAPANRQADPVATAEKTKSHYILSLPELYKPSGQPVFFEKSFIKDLDDLMAANFGLACLVVKKVSQICEQGEKKITIDIKTISNGSERTPANSLQVSLKKYRFTFKVFKDQVVFYELYPRKKSPFAHCPH